MRHLFELGEKESRLIGSDESRLDWTEREIEDLLFNNPQLFGEKILFVGKQEATISGKILDLMAIDEQANILVIELKKGIAPRDIVAQVLDYTSWINSLSEREIEDIAFKHFKKYGIQHESIRVAYESYFGKRLTGRIGETVRPILFADEFPDDIKRPVDYLYEHGIPIECIEFDLYKGSEGCNYLLIDRIIGDGAEQTETARSSSSKPVSPGKKTYFRNMANSLCKVLDDRYDEWASNLKFSKKRNFKVYQSRDNSWTSVYIDWICPDGNKLNLEVGIWPEDEDADEGFSIYFRLKKKPDKMKVILQDKILHDFIIKAGFEEFIDYKNNLGIAKDFYETVVPERMESVSIKFIDMFKPVIERVMEIYESSIVKE